MSFEHISPNSNPDLSKSEMLMQLGSDLDAQCRQNDANFLSDLGWLLKEYEIESLKELENLIQFSGRIKRRSITLRIQTSKYNINSVFGVAVIARIEDDCSNMPIVFVGDKETWDKKDEPEGYKDDTVRLLIQAGFIEDEYIVYGAWRQDLDVYVPEDFKKEMWTIPQIRQYMQKLSFEYSPDFEKAMTERFTKAFVENEIPEPVPPKIEEHWETDVSVEED